MQLINTCFNVLKVHGEYEGLHNNLNTVLTRKHKADHKPRMELIILSTS
jgi:hypothetical protein